MILIKNSQRKIKINTSLIKADMQKILNLINYPDYEISILLTTNKTIQKYNRDFRHKDKPTDILSFPYHPELKPGQQILPNMEDDKNLGDLIISLEYVQKDAVNYNQTFEERLKVLLVHGVCHLLGHDHETDEDYKIMQKQEKFLLKNLK